MSVPRFAGLTNLEQGLLYFGAFVLFNLSAVTLPTNVPKYVEITFFAVGVFAMVIQAELPSLQPPVISASQRVLYLAIATALTSVDAYIAYNAPAYWYVGLVIGIIGAFAAAIRQIVQGLPPPAPPATSSTSGANLGRVAH